MRRPLLLVGCGKMGGALLAGWLARDAAPEGVVIVEPNAASTAAFQGRPGVTLYSDAAELESTLRPSAIVIAVKPQSIDTVLPAYRGFASGSLSISIAAGRTIASLARHLGPDAAIVRSMPNTPAAVGRGITVACANARVDRAGRDLATGLLEAVGEVAWVEAEALLDPVTAVSGSGPAYVFLLIECLAEAGVKSGLPADLAGRLARATVIGSGELARQSSDPAAQLRRNVTSPGGTTEAALKVLMGPEGLEKLLNEAVAAATRRSRELAA
jgi:pyrroline-5-carboxylate reductase